MSCISCVTLCSCSGCEEQWVGFQLLHQVRLCWSTQNAARWLYELHWLCDIARCNDCVVAVVVKNTDAKSCVLRSWLSLSVSCETLKRDPNHNVAICTPLQVSISPSIVSQVTTQSQGPVKAALESNFFSLKWIFIIRTIFTRDTTKSPSQQPCCIWISRTLDVTLCDGLIATKSGILFE